MPKKNSGQKNKEQAKATGSSGAAKLSERKLPEGLSYLIYGQSGTNRVDFAAAHPGNTRIFSFGKYSRKYKNETLIPTVKKWSDLSELSDARHKQGQVIIINTLNTMVNCFYDFFCHDKEIKHDNQGDTWAWKNGPKYWRGEFFTMIKRLLSSRSTVIFIAGVYSTETGQHIPYVPHAADPGDIKNRIIGTVDNLFHLNRQRDQSKDDHYNHWVQVQTDERALAHNIFRFNRRTINATWTDILYGAKVDQVTELNKDRVFYGDDDEAVEVAKEADVKTGEALGAGQYDLVDMTDDDYFGHPATSG